MSRKMRKLLLAEAAAYASKVSRLMVCRATRFASTSSADIPTDEFLPLEIPGHTVKRQTSMQRRKREMLAPRAEKITTESDWTNVWPGASTFKWSVVPLPIRQGYIDKACENEGVSPAAYANNELLKIPNFLHLTPAHVAKHTRALRRFCTAWPKQLTDELATPHFPISVETSAYVRSGASIRDPRARGVRIRFSLSALSLDEHARDKFIRLVGGYESRMYNRHTDMVTLETDRCPSRKQNYDFLIYAMQVLFSEARKTESWETTERTAEDYATFQFELSRSYQIVSDLLRRMRLQRGGADTQDAGQLMQSPEVKEYRSALSNLHDHGESSDNLTAYKRSVLQLLALEGSADKKLADK